MQQQGTEALLLTGLPDLLRQTVDAGEVATGSLLAEGVLRTDDEEATVFRQLAIEGIDMAVVSHIALDGVELLLGGEQIARHIVHADLAVLHAASVVALVFVFQFVLVGHCQLVILLDVYVAALAHLLLRESRLTTVIALVELCLQDAELVLLCLLRQAKTAIALGALVQSGPEVGIVGNDLAVVADGSPRIAGLLQQQRTVVECHEVVGL